MTGQQSYTQPLFPTKGPVDSENTIHGRKRVRNASPISNKRNTRSLIPSIPTPTPQIPPSIYHTLQIPFFLSPPPPSKPPPQPAPQPRTLPLLLQRPRHISQRQLPQPPPCRRTVPLVVRAVAPLCQRLRGRVRSVRGFVFVAGSQGGRRAAAGVGREVGRAGEEGCVSAGHALSVRAGVGCRWGCLGAEFVVW